MNIGWDLDGVLYPWHEIVLDYAKENMGVSKDCTLEGFFGPKGEFHDWPDLTRHNILRIASFYEKSLVTQSNLEILNSLANKHTLFYITSRPEEIEFVTYLWVERSNLPYSKNLFVVGGEKRALVQELSLDYFVDDRPTVVKELHDVTKVILYTRPWNYTYDEPENVIRIHTLAEVEEAINGKINSN